MLYHTAKANLDSLLTKVLSLWKKELAKFFDLAIELLRAISVPTAELGGTVKRVVKKVLQIGNGGTIETVVSKVLLEEQLASSELISSEKFRELLRKHRIGLLGSALVCLKLKLHKRKL